MAEDEGKRQFWCCDCRKDLGEGGGRRYCVYCTNQYNIKEFTLCTTCCNAYHFSSSTITFFPEPHTSSPKMGMFGGQQLKQYTRGAWVPDKCADCGISRAEDEKQGISFYICHSCSGAGKIPDDVFPFCQKCFIDKHMSGRHSEGEILVQTEKTPEPISKPKLPWWETPLE